MNETSLPTPNVRRNIDDLLGRILDKITDNDLGDDDLPIDDLLLPFSTVGASTRRPVGVRRAVR